MRYTANQLSQLPTLTQGQIDDLKIDDGLGTRVWLCREDDEISVEQFDGRRWATVETYPGGQA